MSWWLFQVDQGLSMRCSFAYLNGDTYQKQWWLESFPLEYRSVTWYVQEDGHGVTNFHRWEVHLCFFFWFIFLIYFTAGVCMMEVSQMHLAEVVIYVCNGGELLTLSYQISWNMALITHTNGLVLNTHGILHVSAHCTITLGNHSFQIGLFMYANGWSAFTSFFIYD